jgi:anhydro-N-acetylmuramic acid kinase
VLERLAAMARKPERLVLGLMSGTSMDGVDAALVRLRGGGKNLGVSLERFICHPYEGTLRSRLLQAAGGEALPAVELAALDFHAGAAFAQAALRVAEAAGVAVDSIDLAGSHGQTLAHRAPGGDSWDASTWQAGSPSVIAALLCIPVIGDFRSADVALGGTGAPLVPYADYLQRRSDTESRLLLNVGGIANFTYLPAGCGPDDVLGWDVGPGNMVLDAFARSLFGSDFDAGGGAAARGRADRDWVDGLLRDGFFARAAPKSAGREEFGAAYATRLLQEGRALGLSDADLMASAVRLTGAAVALARSQPPLAGKPVDALYVSGGGRHNTALMQALVEVMAPVRVAGLETLGVDADAKEAVDFAVLANESLLGHAGNLTQVTGAARPCILGTLALAGMRPVPLVARRGTA